MAGLGAVAVVLAAACPAAEAPADGAPVTFDAVAASVNEHLITLGDVLAAMASTQRDLMQRYRGDELRGKLREAFEAARAQSIERKLIVSAFKEEAGQIPDWAVERETHQVVQESFGGDAIEMRRALQADFMTEEDWREMTRERLIVSAMRARKIGGNVQVAPRRIGEYYEAHKDRFAEPESVRLRLIAIGPEGADAEARRAKARTVLERIEAGEDFAAVAREVSDDATDRREGGDWGWVEPASLRRELAEAIAATAAGTVSGAVETEDDIYIVKVEERKARREIPLEDVTAQIERLLREEQAERLYRAWIEGLARNAHVTIRDVDIF